MAMNFPLPPPADGPIPDEFNWGDFGILARLPVHQREQTNYVWVGSEIVEANMQISAIRSGQPGAFLQPSPQAMLDCCLCVGNGYTGGTVPNALDLIRKHMVPCVQHVPMANEDEALHFACRQCKVKDVRTCVGIGGFSVFKGVDEAQLQETVFRYGPLAVGVFVGDRFDQHTGGSILGDVFYTADDEKILDDVYAHYLILMGYGGEGLNRFWIFRNTYTDWGQGGYGLVSRELTPFFDDVCVPFCAFIAEGHA